MRLGGPSGHLLAEHGAYRHLAGVDRAGDPPARGGCDERRKPRIALKKAVDRVGIRIEVEKPATAQRRDRLVARVVQSEATLDLIAPRS